MSTSQPWWKSTTVYQIYPTSFLDTNSDGIGDLQGVLSKLDYIKDLGVDVIWLSPIYRSPLKDMGYDISDYRDIDPRYGSLEDWDNLLKGVHERGMKLMMDLVVNHTSDEHSWFLESKSSKDNPKRDWYIWRSPKFDERTGEQKPPNNWRAVFQGSAWTYTTSTETSYLHLYTPGQPDLNWENPDVREAVWDLMKFWLDRGCDGFRMDVINLISKVEGLPDAPITDPTQEYQLATTLFANGPRVHEYIKEMNQKVLSQYKDLITVGETPFTHSASELAAYVLPSNHELDMVFHFELMDIDSPAYGNDGTRIPLINRKWTLEEFRDVVKRWQAYKRDEGFWNALFIENHDHPRSVSRFGDDGYDDDQNSSPWRALSAKMLALLQTTQSGTLYVYQGQELGLRNFPRSWGIEEYKDVASINYWNRILKERQVAQGKDGVDMSDVLDNFQKKARDHSRVPMQWNASPNAGFTSPNSQPWMRVNDDYKEWNAESQVGNETSVFRFWKEAIRVRKVYDILVYGDYTDICPTHEDVMAYTRSLGQSDAQAALVLLNFKKYDVEVSLPLEAKGEFKFVLGNYYFPLSGEPGPLLDDHQGKVALKGFEARLYIRT